MLGAHLFDTDTDFISLVAALVAAGALVLRRGLPYLAFALTVPGLLLSYAVIAALVALYSMARYTKKTAPLVAGTIVVFLGYAALWDSDSADTVLTNSLYGAMFAVAPLALGLLARTREDLSARIADVERARELERKLIAQRVLTQERARLAREMHDVVSHQVPSGQLDRSPGRHASDGRSGSRYPTSGPHDPRVECRDTGRATAHGRCAARR